jgi:hypothetical protein
MPWATPTTPFDASPFDTSGKSAAFLHDHAPRQTPGPANAHGPATAASARWRVSADEQALRNTSLKDFFFEHLTEVAKLAQVIVVENVDLPENLGPVAHLETFTGDPFNGRFGLFPLRSN